MRFRIPGTGRTTDPEEQDGGSAEGARPDVRAGAGPSTGGREPSGNPLFEDTRPAAVPGGAPTGGSRSGAADPDDTLVDLTRTGRSAPTRESGTGSSGTGSSGTGSSAGDPSVEPDDPRKPASPPDLSRPSWTFAARRAVREFVDDGCTDLAAALTYYAVLSVFPAAIALISLVGVFGQGQTTVDSLLEMLDDVGAGSVTESVEGPLRSLADSRTAGFALVLGIAIALWSASAYVGAFGRAMNRIYEIDEGRPFWKLRPLQLVVTLFVILLVAAVALSLVVTGPVARAVGDRIGLGDEAVTVWDLAKWPVIALVVTLVIAVLYYATPNVRQPRFRWMSVGAFLALVTWVAASALFGLYVSAFGNYDRTYGSLAGIIVFLLWLWITNLALLFGAELDSELERSRELQAGMPAETAIQLPPRDDRGVRKREERDRRAVEQARALREEALTPPSTPPTPR